MGVERYYNYFSEEDFNDIINKTNFKIEKFYKEGGDNNNKWLIYVLKNSLLILIKRSNIRRY